jgi:ubiquinone/menaquinone biosynthesis C-methylase UbiE
VSITIEEEEIDTSYEPFSREPEYIEANRAFIRELDVHRGMSILDLACGTATMTDLLLEHVLNGAERGDGATRAPRVVGMDLSRESLLLAQEHLAALGLLAPAPPTSSTSRGAHCVSLVEGTADRLPFADESFDYILMGNAIQLTNLETMLHEISRVLRPGGCFAFNTSFYAGTYVQGTEHVYIRWVQDALAYVRERDAELRAKGEPGVRRRRGQAAGAFSKPWLSAEQYSAKLLEAGLSTRSVNHRTVTLTQSSFEKIGAYAGLAKVLLSGYPVKLASEALERASGTTLRAVNMPEVPRYWLEMVACKSPA